MKSGFLTKIKDLDLARLEKLDDKELFSVCLLNKEMRELCSDENFWKRRLINKYGLEVAKFKMNEYEKKERRWKDYYLSLVFYENRYSFAEGLNKASEKGYLDIVKYFIVKLNNTEEYMGSIHTALYYAAKAGRKEIIDYFLEKGGQPYMGWQGAIRGNQKELTKFFLEKTNSPVHDYKIALWTAEQDKNYEMIKYLLTAFDFSDDYIETFRRKYL
jgi:hypothetical protein